MRKSNLFCLALLLGLLAEGHAAAAVISAGSLDAGAQMERDRRAIERERIMEQIAEDEAAKKNKVEQGEKPAAEEAGAELSFALQQVIWNPSEILTKEQIQAVTASYIGKQVTLKDLREMADKITNIYRDKGYMTCGAVLPPQRIRDGVVEIRLIEGKTGNVNLTGNRYTKSEYIMNRINLKPGEIANTEKLNRDLRWFQGTNDVQLRVVMKPGAEEGTTDYDIMAFEPQNQSVTLYTDNDGYESSGRWRAGIFYNMKSVSGHRDSLRAHFIGSRGTKSWGLGYSVPISRKGMRLDLDYSGNRTKVVKGELEPLGVEGKSNSYSLTFRAPFHVTEKSRHEAGLQYVHQKSETDLGHGQVQWVDDRIQRVIPYVSFTHYGKDSVLYHKHSFVWARRRDIDGESDTGKLYRLSSFWQKRNTNGQFWQARLDAQLGSGDNLAASDRFFIGGVNSVRGYEEGFIGGSRGISMGLEYHIPVDKAKRIFVYPFFDWGTVGGYAAPEHNKLMSAGLGIEARYKHLYGTLTVGFPFKKDFYDDKVSSARVDFSLSAAF
jgi:hemolysin activation/secretion protein